MTQKITFFLLMIMLALWFGFGCTMQPVTAKPQTVIIPGGTVAPALGVGFDANYDPKLDNIVPGYKILTVAYTNNSMNIIQMDTAKDSWWVENRRGRKVRAITNLRNKDPDTWAELPKRLRVLIEYPLLIPIGTTQTVDLLFKKSVNLNEFKSVTYKPVQSKYVYRIVPRED